MAPKEFGHEVKMGALGILKRYCTQMSVVIGHERQKQVA